MINSLLESRKLSTSSSKLSPFTVAANFYALLDLLIAYLPTRAHVVSANNIAYIFRTAIIRLTTCVYRVNVLKFLRQFVHIVSLLALCAMFIADSSCTCQRRSSRHSIIQCHSKFLGHSLPLMELQELGHTLSSIKLRATNWNGSHKILNLCSLVSCSLIAP